MQDRIQGRIERVATPTTGFEPTLRPLRRQFVPSRPLEGDKWEQLGDNIFLSLYINDNICYSVIIN